MRGVVLAQALAVDVAEHGSAFGAAGPIAARAILAGRECRAVRLRAAQGVMPVGRVAAAIDDVAFFGKRGLLGQVILAMQLRDILGDDDALGIGPGTFADAIAGIGRRLAVSGLRAQISMPGVAAGAGGLRELLAVLIGAGKAAEIGAIAGADAGDEECHG